MRVKEKPQFIISKKKIFEKVDQLNGVFDQISFSWKTNPEVGKILSENDSTYFSIISLNEARDFFSLEVNQDKAKKVWYFPLALDEEDLDVLFGYGVENFVVDNVEDLETLLFYIEKHNLTINLLLRMKLRENTIFTGKHYVFGMQTKTIQELLPRLKENTFVNKLGVHFHRKTQNVSEWSLKQEVAQSLGEEYLKLIDYLNLGGGLPANYMNVHDRAVESIFMRINELKDYVKDFDVKLIIEPGRFIAAPAVSLKAQIIAIHDNACFLNCSIFNGTMDTVVANVKLLVEEELESSQKRYLLKGNTPDSCDILRYSVYLEDPKVGDTLTFLNCGAYTYSTNFCSLEKIEYVIKD